QLISEKVTNRTRSSRQKAMTLRIRVAYGSDPGQVIDLLRATAAANKQVTTKPAPDAFLKEFGADALLFDLTFTTDEVDHWLRIQSDVAVAVNAALRDAGITIPLPQQNVRLEKVDDRAN
ncbi:MAG: mechanosensitive ion channel, partial [Verrucomicrobiota bacterium]|nr:mechanosensitive ion channel [Verrucomicrobiota bacterium]